MEIRPRSIAVAVAAALFISGQVFAGVITHPLGVPGPAPVASGPGLGLVSVPVVTTPSPGNDDQPGGPGLDNNVEVNLKRFDFNDYIDIEFTVAPSNGLTTEYRVEEFVDNNTGIPWVGYRVELGFGTGADFAPAAGAFGLDFDAPLFTPGPTSSAMAISTVSDDELVYSGFHGAGAQQYSFRIDVPDFDAVGGLATFTLRQTPIPIPEPVTLALAGVLSIGWGFSRRRR